MSFDPATTSATPIFKSPPIDEALSRHETSLIRRLRQARREAMTATQPAIVTVHIDGEGQMTWFVAGKEEGQNTRLTSA